MVTHTTPVDGRALRDWWTLLYVPGDVFHVQARSGGRLWAGTYHYNDLDTVVEHLDDLGRLVPDLAHRRPSRTR
ncbi:MAG: hypothetical protein O2917_08790 [Acidobacteria bacterium]|nr:hypothetical protein [Acidobacteriota bacterium]